MVTNSYSNCGLRQVHQEGSAEVGRPTKRGITADTEPGTGASALRAKLAGTSPDAYTLVEQSNRDVFDPLLPGPYSAAGG